jgi:hypothetical protein
MTGILVLTGIPQFIDHRFGIGFGPWFLLGIVISYIFYRRTFKTTRSFRYFLIKKYININSKFRRIDHRLVSLEKDDEGTNALQEKAVKLWKLCLRDKETNISCSISTRTRQIEKNNMLIILSPLNTLDYLMTIIDVDKDKSCLYEIRMSDKVSDSVIAVFDNENEKRMKEGEEERRKSIYNDLDKLLTQEEQALNKKTSE